MATELLQTISKDEIERARFRSRRMFRMDAEHDRLVAQDEKAIEIAKNLLKMGMPVDQVVTATGLTSGEVEALHGIG